MTVKSVRKEGGMRGDVWCVIEGEKGCDNDSNVMEEMAEDDMEWNETEIREGIRKR